MCVEPHIASLTTPVNVFCSPGVCARIVNGMIAAAASIGIAFAENMIFIVLSPLDGLKSLPKLLVFLLRFSWPQSAASQSALLHQRKEHRDKNQHMNGGRDHPADDGRGNGFHHVRADAGFHRMGIRLAKTTQTVISFGRKRCTAPSIVASSMSSCFSGFPDARRRSSASCRYTTMTTPVSTAMPKRAM